MRYFNVLFFIYVCECHDEWYRRFDDKNTGISSDNYYRSLGSDGEYYFGDKQNNSKNHDDERSDKGDSVEIDSDNDRKGFKENGKKTSEINKQNDNTSDGATEIDSYDGKKDKNNNKDKHESDFRNTNYEHDDIYSKNDDRDYGVNIYDNRSKLNSDRRTNNRKYEQNRFIGKRKNDNNRCRYIGPLYDSRKLDKFEYRSDEEYSRSNWNREEYDKYNGQYDHRCRSDDKDDEIVRPCALNDWECIRKFLANNSECKPAYGPTPDPIYIPVDKFFIPVVNLTITHTDLKVKGFESTKITEFYLNKDTGNLVIAIDVLKVNQSSPKSFFTYQRTAKEPIVLADFTTVQYKKITFTAVLPDYPHLRLDKAEIHADVDGLPTYKVGPGIYNSKDPDVVEASTQFKLNIPMVVQEAYVFQSFLLTATYIQRSVCDFGIDVYGNYLRFLKSKSFIIRPKLNDYN